MEALPMPSSPERFARIGNALSADFINTVFSPEHPEGSLRTGRDVVDFLEATGTASADDAARLRRSVGDPAAAQALLNQALELRAAVTAAYQAIEQRQPLARSALDALNAVLEADAGFDRVRRHGSRYELAYERTNAAEAAALAPIARETARFLTTPGTPVRQCAGEGCVRHFYDDSRTGRRRWCEMAICGNRAKAAAFSQRRRGAGTPS